MTQVEKRAVQFLAENTVGVMEAHQERRGRVRRHDRVKRLRGRVERGWSGDASNDASEFRRKNMTAETCEINGFAG
jgi:hypothetical protein